MRRLVDMKLRNALPLLVIAVVLLVACGGARVVTERNMLEWCPALNTFMAGNTENAMSYPASLDELPPEMRAERSDTDGWGNKILYRRLGIDLYNLISAGPDGEFGNNDDIIVQNGALYKPEKIYAEHPFKK
jgi:hypothetical protein